MHLLAGSLPCLQYPIYRPYFQERTDRGFWASAYTPLFADASYRLVTVITSFGGSWYGDRLLSSCASRVIRIEQPSKKRIRIIDNGTYSSTSLSRQGRQGSRIFQEMQRMFLLDIRYDNGTITKWIRDDAGTRLWKRCIIQVSTFQASPEWSLL